MSKIRLNINGHEICGFDGQTILEIAKENGISIPTLCHDERVKMYGSCGLCVVEAEGNPKLIRSCSTFASDGMVICTDSDRVRGSRKTALELLLTDHKGDCRPPCSLACPAGTDCQGYVGLIANGEYEEAVKLVKDKIPLPGSIGRVCPHPCEEACRRQLVEEPVNIAALKSFVADKNMEYGSLYTAGPETDTGKTVAVIGGGPGGLTAAYFLRSYGHDVTVYDAMPHMGGMLRYGIPEYRLPKDYLQREIDAIEGMGVRFIGNIKIGSDLTLSYLQGTYDAVVVAVGAWISTDLRCPGEELDGVVGGINFLQDAALGKASCAGLKVAVVGGGNTAMDACRTAVRLGAEKVYNVYRRTKAEMPAEAVEIKEAEEEGVVFKNLTNPIEVAGENGQAKSMRLQIMELGEPDASGRCAPVPVEGQEETIDVDLVIVAIGQKLDPTGLEDIELTKRGTVSADEATFRTSCDGVFAVGDATNKGADIAVSAIGEAQKASVIIDRFLNGEDTGYKAPYVVTSEPTAEDFAGRETQPRAKMPHLSPEMRRGNFAEVNFGLSEEEAVREAGRCLECGCHDYYECKLIEYVNQYTVEPERLCGEMHNRTSDDDHPYISRNPNKCILCGLCVRVCDEVVGVSALGLVDRGFDTTIKPALDSPLNQTGCVSCGQCVAVCPTGALTETMMIRKQVPTLESCTDTVCSFCGVGCNTRLTHTGDMLIRSLPTAERDENALLCMKGRFGFGELAKTDRLCTPLVRSGDGSLSETSFEKAYIAINKQMRSLQSQYGKNAVAVAVSDHCTNEEVLLVTEYAKTCLGIDGVYSFGMTESGLPDVLGHDGSTADFDQMERADLIVLVGGDVRKHHGVVGMRINRAVMGGAKLIALGESDSFISDLADMTLDIGDDLDILRQILKAVMDESGRAKDLPGYESLVSSLADVQVSDMAQSAADTYVKAKHAVIVFEQDALTPDAARLLADMTLCVGQSQCGGVIQLKRGPNSQGIANLGVLQGDMLREKMALGNIKGLLIFGEDVPELESDKLQFLAVQELQMTDTAKEAHVVLPARSYTESGGTFTNTVGKMQRLKPAVASCVEPENTEIIAGLIASSGIQIPLRTADDIRRVLSKFQNRDCVQQPKLCAPEGNQCSRWDAKSTNAVCRSLRAFAEANSLV